MSEIFVLNTDRAKLVFGLAWHALLDAPPAKAGRRMARQRRATHMTVSGFAHASVGLAFLDQRLRRSKGLHSAAQVVARMFPEGTYTLALELNSGIFWLVGVHEGAVIARTDTLHGDLAQVRSLLSELAQAYPQLIELGSDGAPLAPTLSEIELAICSEALLVKVRPTYTLWFGFLLVASLLVVSLHWPYRQTSLGNSHEHTAEMQLPLALNSTVATTSVSSITLHGKAGLLELLDNFYTLPLRIERWSLERAECLDAVQLWQCEAYFKRGADNASSAAFLRAAPSSWKVDFPSLDTAYIQWAKKNISTSLHEGPLADKADNDRLLFSGLQAISKVFQRIDIGVSHPLKPQGVGSAPQFMTRSLYIEGPLRSFSLLPPYAHGMGWSKAVLWHRPTNQFDAQNSQLVFSLSGTLYETTMPDYASDDDANGSVSASLPD